MKVYRVNDCEWYMALTLDEAIAKAMEDSGLPRDEAADGDACEVSPDEMNRLIFVEDDDLTKRTFAEELALRVADGQPAQAFATTEY